MSFETELTRVAGGAKDTLKALITKLGGTVADEKIDNYPELAEAIEFEEGQSKITVNGILKGDGEGNITAAIAGEDYPDGSYIIENNKNEPQRFWRGTKEEYDAVETKADDTLYIVTNEDGNNIDIASAYLHKQIGLKINPRGNQIVYSGALDSNDAEADDYVNWSNTVSIQDNKIILDNPTMHVFPVNPLYGEVVQKGKDIYFTCEEKYPNTILYVPAEEAESIYEGMTYISFNYYIPTIEQDLLNMTYMISENSEEKDYTQVGIVGKLLDQIPQEGIPGQVLTKTSTGTAWTTTDIKLASISIETMPSTTIYEYGDTLDITGLTLRAYWTDETSNIITSGFSCSISTLNSIGKQIVTIYYTEGNITQSTIFNVTVNRKSVTKPTWKSNLTYNGSAQSVSDTSSWDNYNTTYMTIGGTTSATNAGTYKATFTLKDNYRWTDETITTLDINWTINKATGSLSVSPTTVAINGNNYSSGVAVTITRAGNGVISYSPKEITGLTLTLNNNVLTVKGDGSTAVAATNVTISVAAGDNHLAPANVTISIGAEYWSWGIDGGTVDAAWFAGLKNYLKTHTGASLKTSAGGAVLGTTKSVTLSSAVLGTTTHLIRVIGVDQDADNTVTWQTANMLSTVTVFSNSSAVWFGSTARSLCESYYNAFPGKDAIKTVSKGTCANYNNSRAGTVTYNNETVWLPSEREMGLDSFSPLSVANSTTSNAECTQGKNFSYAYYTSDTNRVKKQGDSGNAYYYWERSRYYSSYYTDRVCIVYSDGSADINIYYNSSGLAPAFVIGN